MDLRNVQCTLLADRRSRDALARILLPISVSVTVRSTTQKSWMNIRNYFLSLNNFDDSLHKQKQRIEMNKYYFRTVHLALGVLVVWQSGEIFQLFICELKCHPFYSLWMQGS